MSSPTPGIDQRPLGLYYRGSLSSCNFACNYCPFAKSEATIAALKEDESALHRFLEWTKVQTLSLEILFTPYGEALIWPAYRHALANLSTQPNVRRVGVQTNLSGPLDFLEVGNPNHMHLWVSFHPTEVSIDRFLQNLRTCAAAGAGLSVGMVALPEHEHLAVTLRDSIPPTASFWLNAPKPPKSLGPRLREHFVQLDPYFVHELRGARSRGRACETGKNTLLISGDGTARRCHFVEKPLGNIYTENIDRLLYETPCPRARCDCWIGYAHLDHLNLKPRALFRDHPPQ